MKTWAILPGAFSWQNAARLHSLRKVDFLSAEWLRAADTALRAAASSAPGGRFVIDQHVTGLTSYRMIVDPHGSSVARIGDGTATQAEAHAVFTQTAATATAIARGQTDAHQAFLLGDIRFVGAIDVLIERREAFDWLERVLAPVMARTVFANL